MQEDVDLDIDTLAPLLRDAELSSRELLPRLCKEIAALKIDGSRFMKQI